jgi:hypothetical protein
MNHIRALNNVSEFKTPIYVSPEKNDNLDSLVKSVLPNMKVTQFMEPIVFRVEETKDDIKQNQMETDW